MSNERKTRRVNRVGTAAPRLFLGYSHRDKRFVRQLARDLEHLSVDVWMDEWEIEPGDSLHTRVGAALKASAYIGVVLSPDSVRSRWCRKELEQALAREMRGKKVIIPLLCRRVTPPPFLEDRLYLDFRRAYYTALTRLAGMVHGMKPRDLSPSISARPPRGFKDVLKVLGESGWSPAKELSEREFETIRRILGRVGVHLSTDEFEVVSRPRNPRARRKKALLK